MLNKYYEVIPCWGDTEGGEEFPFTPDGLRRASLRRAELVDAGLDASLWLVEHDQADDTIEQHPIFPPRGGTPA